jgi:hypothetical protein
MEVIVRTTVLLLLLKVARVQVMLLVGQGVTLQFQWDKWRQRVVSEEMPIQVLILVEVEAVLEDRVVLVRMVREVKLQQEVLEVLLMEVEVYNLHLTEVIMQPVPRVTVLLVRVQ